jgi:hypothetical protein
MKKAIVFIFVVVFSKELFANVGIFDAYISYNNELRFRAGLDYKNIGIYLRPVFTDERDQYYTGMNEFVTYTLKRKGAELGINLNKTLFTYKKTEIIVNLFSGYILSQVNESGNTIYWEKSADLGIIPEIRFFKKASITLTPYYYRYYWPNKEAINQSRSSTNYLNINLLQMSIGFKFYY